MTNCYYFWREFPGCRCMEGVREPQSRREDASTKEAQLLTCGGHVQYGLHPWLVEGVANVTTDGVGVEAELVSGLACEVLGRQMRRHRLQVS